jgi:hypothetical protein
MTADDMNPEGVKTKGELHEEKEEESAQERDTIPDCPFGSCPAPAPDRQTQARQGEEEPSAPKRVEPS